MQILPPQVEATELTRIFAVLSPTACLKAIPNGGFTSCEKVREILSQEMYYGKEGAELSLHH